MTDSAGILDACLHPDAWLHEEPPQREFLLTSGDLRLLPMGTAGLVVGPGGVSKSTLMCQLAVSVASGRPWMGQLAVRHPGHVLLIAAEESDLDLRRRLYFAVKAAKADADEQQRLADRLHAFPGSGRDVRLLHSMQEMRSFLSAQTIEARIREGHSAQISPWAEHLYWEMGEAGCSWSLIVFDPAARCGGAGFELDSEAATRFIEVLERFTTLPGNPCVLLVHHTSKASRRGITDATAARGSSGLSDAVRWQLNLEPVPDPENPELDHPRLVRCRWTKQNLTARDGRAHLLWRGDEGILWMATEEEARSLEGGSSAPAPTASKKAASRRTSPKTDKPASATRPLLSVVPPVDKTDDDYLT